MLGCDVMLYAVCKSTKEKGSSKGERVFFISNFRGTFTNRKDLRALTLVRTIRGKPSTRPLAVLHLEN